MSIKNFGETFGHQVKEDIVVIEKCAVISLETALGKFWLNLHKMFFF